MSVSYAEYKKYRKEHPLYEAKTVWSILTSIKKNEDKWGHVELFTNSVCNFKYNGFDIEARLEPDEWCETDWGGKFTDKWSPGVITNPNWGRSSEYQREHGGGICHYWLPANPWRESWKFYREQLKLSRHDAYTRARKEAYQDADRQEDRSVWVLTVRAFKAGVALGSDSLSGIEFDATGLYDPYIYELFNDMVPSAIGAADAIIKKLCAAT